VTAWCKAVPGGVELLVLVQPRASRSRIVGEHDGRLKLQLAAPPVDGEANAALVELLCELLKVRKADVELLDGQTGRRKRLRVTGVEAAAVEAVMGHADR
jgi:uncharacterized protein (TIGR00251 family)